MVGNAVERPLYPSDPIALFRPCPYLFGTLLIVVGAGVISGANLAPLALAAHVPAVAGMGANTGLGFLLLGVFLVLTRGRWRKIAGLLMVVGVLAVVVQMQHFLALHPADGPWRLLVNTLPEAGAWAGRMSPATAFIFLLYALSGLLFAYRGAQRAEVAFFGLALGAMIALAYLASHLVRFGLSDHDHSVNDTVSPATALLLTLAGVGLWRAAEIRLDVRAWRSSSPGWDLFVQAASSVGALLVVGGIVAGSLMQQGRETLAVGLVALLALGAATFLYLRIVPVLARLQRTEDRLRATSRRQELLLHHAGQGICGLDSDGSMTFANPAAGTLLGYSAAELAGQPMHPLLHHTRRDGRAYPMTECPIHATLADGLTRRVDDEVFWRADGTALEVEYVVAAIKTQGRILGAVVLFSDIAERRRIAAVLARWQHLFEHAEWGVVICAEDGQQVELMNPAFARMHGYSVEQLIGRPIVDLLAPECGKDLAVNMRLAREKGHHIWESWHSRKDGASFPVQLDATTVKDGAGQVLYFVINLQDISTRRQAEAIMLESAAHLARVQTQAKLGSWWLDAPRNELYWSEETHRIFGVPGDMPLTPEFFFDCVHPDDRVLVERAWKAALLGRPYDVQHRIVADGEVKWVRERAELESFPDGSLRRAEGTVQDITEIKRHEDELLRSRQNLRDLAAHHKRFAKRSAAAWPARFTTNWANTSPPCAWTPPC